MLLLLLAAGSLAACNKDNGPYKTEITMKEVMGDVVDPAAQSFWKRSGEDDTLQGTISRVPKPDDEENWLIAENGGTQLAEAANLLLLPSRRRDDGDWVKFAHALHDAGKAANEAAAERSGEKMFKTGADVYQVCTDCHQKYLLPFLDKNGQSKAPGAPGSSGPQ